MTNKRYYRKPEPLGNVMERLLKRLNIDFDARRIWEVWKEVVGEPIANRAHPDYIKQKTLCVRVSNSAWLQDLQFRRDEIIERINDRLGRPMVENILFKIGPVEQDSSGPQGSDSIPSGPMDQDVRSEIEEHLSKIKDPDLRESIRKAIERRERETNQE